MRVIHFGNIANVGYLLAYGLRKYFDVDALLVYRECSKNSIEFRMLYNFESGNPYKVPSLVQPRKPLTYLKLFKRMNADVIQFHGGLQWKRLIPVVLSKVKKSKIVDHFHGSDLRETGSSVKIYDAIFADATLVSTPDLLGYLLRKKNAVFLPNPIDPKFFSKTSRDSEYSIFTIRLDPPKNYEFNFKAWQILREMDKDIILKVIKWGEDFPKCYQKFSGDNRIKWLPILNREEMIEELCRNYIVWEQQGVGVFGMVGLEAMALSIPVFARFNKKFSLSGKYLPPVITCSSPREQAEKTYDLLMNNNKRREIGTRSREWAARYHELKNVCERLMKVYQKIL